MANLPQQMQMNKPMSMPQQPIQPQSPQNSPQNPDPRTVQTQPNPEDKSSIKAWIWFMIGLIVGIGLAAVYFYFF